MRKSPPRPSRQDAEKAVRTILSFIGENPDREGLKETPKRFVDAYLEMFDGYSENPDRILGKTFAEIEYQNESILVKDIRLVSFCEHHLLPIVGKAHVAYVPGRKVVGISKLARLVDVYSKRLQTQEILTRQIHDCIVANLRPKGVAVQIGAYHYCMSLRGAKKTESQTVTSQFSGKFKEDPNLKTEFLAQIR